MAKRSFARQRITKPPGLAKDQIDGFSKPSQSGRKWGDAPDSKAFSARNVLSSRETGGRHGGFKADLRRLTALPRRELTAKSTHWSVTFPHAGFAKELP